MPTAPPAPRPAFDALAASVGQAPMHSDPALQPSKTRSVLGRLAGAALGAGEGFVNASGRARIQPGGGAALADGIVNAKFNKATRDYNEKQANLKAQADIEQARLEDQRRQAESTAKIGAAQAAQTASQAKAAKAAQPTPVKPVVANGAVIDPSTGKVIYKPDAKPAPTPQTIDQYINEVSLDPTLTPEVKQDRIQKRIELHNQAHPEKAITKVVQDDNGNLTAVTVNPGDVAKAGGRMALGAGGKTTKKAAPAAGAGPATGISDVAQGVLDGRVIYEKLNAKDKSAVRKELLKVNPSWREETALTSKQKDALDKMNSIDTMIKKLEDTYAAKNDLPGIGTVAGSSLGQIANERLGFGDASGVGNRAVLSNIASELIHEKYGSALSKGENERAKTFIPGPGDPPKVVIEKLKVLKQFHDAKRSEWNSGKTSPAAPATPAGGPKVGDVRTGPDGKKYRITAIRGDEVDAVPVQ